MTGSLWAILRRHMTVFRRTLITNMTYSLIEPLLYLRSGQLCRRHERNELYSVYCSGNGGIFSYVGFDL
ncbi:hypothetical protein P22_2153 [Propionispora sp. 2/2-37]|nr:hypothetical protein P22_2153 [Propionispora sp. 2/2-37]